MRTFSQAAMDLLGDICSLSLWRHWETPRCGSAQTSQQAVGGGGACPRAPLERSRPAHLWPPASVQWAVWVMRLPWQAVTWPPKPSQAHPQQEGATVGATGHLRQLGKREDRNWRMERWRTAEHTRSTRIQAMAGVCSGFVLTV